MRLFLKDQFRSDLRAPEVRAPVLILHGEKDAVVPIDLGKRLYSLIQAPKRFVTVKLLNAVVDHDGDQAPTVSATTDMPIRIGPDASKANSAKHERDLGGRVAVPSTSRLR